MVEKWLERTIINTDRSPDKQHRNVAKIAVCTLNTREHERQTDRQACV